MASMSSPLAVKRRKLNETSKALSKPFVSPLKTSKSDPTALKQQQNAPPYTPYRPSMLAHTIITPSSSDAPAISASKPQSSSVKKPTPIRKPLNNLTNRNNRDPAEIAAQKEITSLELRIRTLRNETDTLSQAARLRTSNRDAELEELALKWRAAAQSAAEEVFGSVKDRVQRMGGVQAWRESEKKKWDRMHHQGEFAEPDGGEEDDDEDCEFDSQGEELPEEEQEWRKSEKRRLKKERMEAMEDEGDVVGDDGGGEEVKGKVWEEPGAEDDEFTIDMMLRSLNIDLDVIGYDKTLQRWNL